MDRPLTDAQIRALPSIPKGGKRQVLKCGFGLFLVNEPVVGSEPCRRFIFRYVQKLAGGQTKQHELAIGTYGRGGGRLTLVQARQAVLHFKAWRKAKGLHAHHSDWLAELRPAAQEASVTLRQVCDEWMRSPARQRKSPSTQKECERHLENHVFKVISPEVPIENLEWDSGDGSGGRRLVQQVREVIEARGSHDMANRVIRTLGQVCDFAIEKGWMRRGQNPCTISPDDRAKHESKGNPTVSADQVPEFFQVLNAYGSGKLDITVTALKMHLLLCTRPGALVALEWAWINDQDALCVIPGETLGLKRPADQKNIDHLIPISDPVLELLDVMRRINGDKSHVFWSVRAKGYPHLNPSSLNNLMKVQLGLGGVLTAQGWRDVVQTVGVDVLKYPWEVPDRQLGHLPHKKGVRGHYDNSELLDERRRFMDDWSNWCIVQGLEIP